MLSVGDGTTLRFREATTAAQRLLFCYTETADVPWMSRSSGNPVELIDSAELANRWKVPESWIRNHTRARTAPGIG
jgi:hypothetical protein